jgi:hypothetical protein
VFFSLLFKFDQFIFFDFLLLNFLMYVWCSVKVKLTKDMFRVLNVLNSSLESASLNDTSIENTNLDRNSVFKKNNCDVAQVAIVHKCI